MFCYKCGNQIREDQAFCDKCGTPQNKSNGATDFIGNPLESQEESRSSILQFIRGIPFGLVFLALLLPLFVVSCPQVGKDIASYSAYQSIDIVGSLSELLGQVGQFVADSDIEELQNSLFKFSIMCAVMLVLTVAAFGLSFIKRIVAAVLGIAGFLDMIIVVVCLCGRSTNVVTVSPGSGFYLAVLLFLVGVIMCFITPMNETELPSGAKIGIYIGVVVVSAIIVAVGFTGTNSANTGTIVDSRDGNKYKTVTIDGKIWLAENVKYKMKTYCPENSEKLCKKKGRLYSWEQAKIACPPGFHLPMEYEMKTILSLTRERLKKDFKLESVGYYYTDEGESDFGNTDRFWVHDSVYMRGYDFYQPIYAEFADENQGSFSYCGAGCDLWLPVRCVRD
jgi:uncharacterized protein (TIGR02145 family)